MTTLETQKLIGSTARLYSGSVGEFEVKILDIKNAYGVQRALVENPLNKKTAWKNLDTLTIKEGV